MRVVAAGAFDRAQPFGPMKRCRVGALRDESGNTLGVVWPRDAYRSQSNGCMHHGVRAASRAASASIRPH